MFNDRFTRKFPWTFAVSSYGGANGILCAGIPPLGVFGTASASETFYFQASDLYHTSPRIKLYFITDII